MPSMSCCPLRHWGTGVWCSQGMGCCGAVWGQSADRLRSEFCVFWGSCFHFGNIYEGLSVRIYGFLGDKGV